MLALFFVAPVFAARLLLLDPIIEQNVCDVRIDDIAIHLGNSFATIPGKCPPRVVVDSVTLEVFYERDGEVFGVLERQPPRSLGKDLGYDWARSIDSVNSLWDSYALDSAHISPDRRYRLGLNGQVVMISSGEEVTRFFNAPLIVWLP
jgi:hypothetical protein